MLRSIFSGITGLRAHQQMMDVVGNNIANVNTAGYKAQNAVFESVISQAVKSPAAPVAAGVGGLDSGVTDVLIALGDMPMISAEMVQILWRRIWHVLIINAALPCQVVMASEETR